MTQNVIEMVLVIYGQHHMREVSVLHCIPCLQWCKINIALASHRESVLGLGVIYNKRTLLGSF